MPLRVPPPEVPVIKWLSPNKADQGLLEFWNTELASYVPLDVGAAHPNTRDYSGYTLGKQTPVQGDEKWVMRIWVTPETSPEWFNWAEKYSAEDNAYPIFIRTYREPKATYTPRAKQSSLGAFYKLVLSNSGSGFTPGTSPEVIFDADSDTPAVAHGVVAPDGTLTECVLTDCGDGYSGNVAFRVDAPANGNPAEGTAYIQPATAILVKEEASQYPEDSEFYAQYLQVTRLYETLPGPTLYSTKLDVDGAILTMGTTRKLCADITTGEDITAGVWTKTTKRQTDIDFVCEEVTEVRVIPGNVMYSTKIDVDGKVITRTQTYVESSTIVSSESIVAGVWVKVFKEDVDGTDLVSWQITESRDVPGNPMVKTVIDDAGDTITDTRTMVEGPPTLVTTITTAGGVYTKTFGEPISDLVSWKVVQVKATQNELDSFEVSIPDLIPQQFRGVAPLTTTEQTLIGTASLPTLATGDIMRREAQIDFNTYRLTISGRAGISLPVTLTDQETTEEFGGGVLNVVMKLNTLGSDAIETGLLVVSSEIKNLGNGLQIRTTKTLDAGSWPTLPGTSFDREMQVYTQEEEQTVDKSYSVDVPGVGDFFVESLKPIDDWRGKRIKITKTPTADSLANALIEEIDGPFQFPGIVYLAPSGLGYYRRQASAQLCQQIIRTWWLSSATKPTRGLPGSGDDVEVQDIIMDDIIISTLNDITVLAYSGMCLHDAITTFGTFTYAATIPSATDYIAMIGSEIVVGATIELTDIPNLWKIVTKSVIAR